MVGPIHKSNQYNDRDIVYVRYKSEMWRKYVYLGYETVCVRFDTAMMYERKGVGRAQKIR